MKFSPAQVAAALIIGIFFYSAPLTSFAQSASNDQAILELLKKLQEQDGSATFEEKQSLMFRANKND